MSQWLIALLKGASQRVIALLGRGASVKTAHYEIRASTSDGVVTILQAVHELAGNPPIASVAKQ